MHTDWLQRYARGYHRWTCSRDQNAVIFYRPLGIVEGSFDADGVYHEGRADINMALEFEIKTTMSREALRRHIILAWACLRLRHALLCAAASPTQGFMDDEVTQKTARWFIVRKFDSREDAVQSSESLAAFLDDFYPEVDADELYFHAQNTARTFDSAETLARMLVLPLEETKGGGSYSLRFLFTMSHQISDGLTNHNWAKDFMQLLNKPSEELDRSIPPLIATIHERLPPPQEDLYQPVSGSRARQRWFWAITLVLRHVQKPMPAVFPNPLRRSGGPIAAFVPERPMFDRVLDYSRPPKLNAGTIRARVGREGTARLHRLCRQAGCSVGAGCFVLVAVVMMELYERRFPDVPPGERQPFMGSFPINPRPFFDHHADADGVMLAFSDGVVLPFLPSGLGLDGRVKLLMRSAQRQLSRYQKRPRAATVGDVMQYMGPRGAGRIVPMTYLDTLERANARVAGGVRVDLGYGEFMPKQTNPTMATCGVSSVGRLPLDLRPGRFDLDRPLAPEGDIVADIRGMRQNVRPRDGEFLVGVEGTEDSIHLNANIDASTIDMELAAEFEREVESILDRTAVHSKL